MGGKVAGKWSRCFGADAHGEGPCVPVAASRAEHRAALPRSISPPPCFAARSRLMAQSTPLPLVAAADAAPRCDPREQARVVFLSSAWLAATTDTLQFVVKLAIGPVLDVLEDEEPQHSVDGVRLGHLKALLGLLRMMAWRRTSCRPGLRRISSMQARSLS